MVASVLSSVTSPSWIGIWFLVEFVSIIIVIFGCGGEAWAEYHRFSDKVKTNPNSQRLSEKLLPAEVKERWKKRFGWMIVFGLTIELIAFGLSYLASNQEIEGLQKSNLVLQNQVEGLRASNNALAKQAAEFARIIAQTQNELEETEEPMGFDKLEYSGGFLNPFTVALGQIPKTHIMLFNVTDAKAEYTVHKLADAFQWSHWSFEGGDEIPKSCLGIYIGVNKWGALDAFHNLYKIDTNNPCENSALALLKLLTENGIPTRTGGAAFGISVPTNAILIVVGQRPGSLTTKMEILDNRRFFLDLEERETMYRLGINQPATQSFTTNRLGISWNKWYSTNVLRIGSLNQMDQTNLANLNRIHEERQKLENQQNSLREEEWQRNLNLQKNAN